MSIEKLFPAGRKPETPDEIQAVFNNIIISINFLPGIRRRLRWRGVYRVPGPKECWTFKIGNLPGVFGILYKSGVINNGWLTGQFYLYYFPAPDDPLLDSYSINAALISQQNGYLAMIREFSNHPEMEDYFHIGHLMIGLSPEGKSLFFGVEGQSRMQIQSVDGVAVPVNGTDRQLIAPGELEQDIPSYELYFLLYEILASSITYLADAPPCGFMESIHDGFITRYRSDGFIDIEESSDIKHILMMIAYGDESGFRTFITDTLSSIEPGIKSTQWYRSDCPLPPPLEGANWWISHGNFNSKSQGVLSGESLSLLPLIIITGFLGSGKTSFIKNFVENQMQKNRFTAVIQNELGKTGLDGKLLSDECAVIEMDEGCVCCSLAGNLRIGINKIMEEFDPDFILLETTGAANPMNLLDELDDIKDIVRLDSITTLIDAANIFEILENYSVAFDQVKAANIVIINKRDLVEENTVERIKTRIREINPEALILDTVNGDINPFLIFNGADDEFINIKKEKEPLNHHTHIHDHISAYTLAFDSPLDREKFIRHIDPPPPGIFRIKGIVRFFDDDKLWVIQYVGGRYTIESYTSAEIVDSFITIIGKNLDEKLLTAHFSS